LRELVLAEVHFRRQQGERPVPEEYRARFPDLEPSWLADSVPAASDVPGVEVRPGLAAEADSTTLGSVAQSLADPEPQASLAAAGATLATSHDHPPIEDGLRYRILRPHAQGGLGIVSVASDVELGREVAFKEIQFKYAEDGNLRSRFVREAEITGGLEHPGIVPVYGLGRYADGRPYYAMRLIRGESLQEATRKLYTGAGSHTLRDLLARFVAVCNAVAYAHSRGVIHRDIKPSNVMLGPYGETLVVDWGLAKVIGRQPADAEASPESTLRPPSGESSHTQAGAALGTPAFMSPEQARGEVDSLGPATDVYSLGATLYAVLTGQPPVQGRDTAEVLEKVRQADWLAPRLVSASVSKALDAICRKAMALKPANRYGTPLELAGDIEHWLADAPVTAWREPWTTRASRWIGRHRTKVVGGLVATVVGLLAGVVGLVWWQRDLERRRAGFEAALDRISELQAKERWAEARAVLEQAEDRSVGTASARLQQRLETARHDLTLVGRLDDLRMQRALIQRTFEKTAKLDKNYEEAFVEAGLGGPDDGEAAVAERVASSAVRDVLVASLDDWALVSKGQRRAWALAVARRADPDPWRDQLRDPAAWEDDDALAKTVASAPAGSVTPGLAAAVGGRLESAKEGEGILRAAAALRPGDFWLNFRLGYLLQQLRRPGESEVFYRVSLVARPDSTNAHNGLAIVLAELRKNDDAAAHYRRAIELDPENHWAYSNLGLVLARQGKSDEALAAFRKSVALSPWFPMGHRNLGAELERQGRLDEAAAQYRIALQLSPRFELARQDLYLLLDRQGNANEAVAVCRKAVDLNPNDPGVHMTLGGMLHRQGKLDEAVAAYRRAADLDPKNAAAFNNMGCALRDQGKLDEAAASLRTANSLAPRDASLSRNLGTVLERQGHFEEAVELYRRAVEWDPKDVESQRNLGALLRRLGRN
jgi:Flp pilus assembly protein TadD